MAPQKWAETEGSLTQFATQCISRAIVSRSFGRRAALATKASPSTAARAKENKPSKSPS